MSMKVSILAWLAMIGGTIVSFLGGWDSALQTLLIFMAADYITGIIVAGVFKNSDKSKTGALESRAGFKGLLRKLAILVLILVANELDKAVGGNFSRTAVILFFCANEGLSILENIGMMGVEYPPFLKNALEALKKKNGADDK